MRKLSSLSGCSDTAAYIISSSHESFLNTTQLWLSSELLVEWQLSCGLKVSGKFESPRRENFHIPIFQSEKAKSRPSSYINQVRSSIHIPFHLLSADSDEISRMRSS